MSAERLKKLVRMSPHEVFTRTSQEFAKRRDVLSYRIGIDPFRAPRKLSSERGRFYRDPPEIPEILRVFRERLPQESEQTIARADDVLAGRFHLLGYRNLDFSSASGIHWGLDPVHRKAAALLPWPSVPYLDFAASGDHKIVWELNRHQFLPLLAKAYRLSGDTRYASHLIELWYDWRRKNPYPLGINWASSLEVAFRALSWMWTGFLLAGTPADTEAFQSDLAFEVARSGWYLARFLSTYFSPNTHLQGEAFALFAIGCAYPALHGAAQWKREGWRILLEESVRQVRPDGLHFEQSTYYHVYALDFFLHARVLASRNNVSVPKEYDAVIRKMLDAVSGLAQAGVLPRFGDDDGGRLFDGSRTGDRQLLDPLSSGAVLFGDARLKSRSAGLCEETLWLLGADSAAAFDGLPSAAAPLHATAFPDAGIYTMTSNAPVPAQLFIDAGVLGALSGGHGHADLLSIQLAAAGRLILTDPGTGAYMGTDRVRDRFRGTAAHNTVTVDGQDQAEGRGPFAWASFPPVTVHRWEPGERASFFEASHHGYPVVHRRIISGLDSGIWLVRDLVEGSGEHALDIYWHFAPGISVQTHATGLRAHGEAVPPLSLVAVDDPRWHLTIETGEYSPVYGLLVPAPVARFSARIPCPSEFAVVLALGDVPPDTRLERTPAGYRYSAGGLACLFPLDGPPL